MAKYALLSEAGPSTGPVRSNHHPRTPRMADLSDAIKATSPQVLAAARADRRSRTAPHLAVAAHFSSIGDVLHGTQSSGDGSTLPPMPRPRRLSAAPRRRRRATRGYEAPARTAGAGSGGHRNASVSASDGVLKPRVCRGLPFSSAAMPSRSAWVKSRRLTWRGRYWRSRPLVFSLLPRCHGLFGSQK